MELTRRELFMLTLAACGGGSSTPTIDAPPPNCVANGARANISYNHGHVFSVPAADIAGGAQHSYDITGSADHSHTVGISADQMATLASNRPLQVTSSAGGGHTHMIDVYCR